MVRRPSLFNGSISGALLLLIAAAAFLCITGCSRSPEDPGWFQATDTGEALSDDALIARINSVSDLITICRMQEEYSRSGGGSTRVQNAMEKHLQQLLADQTPVGSPCPEADLLAFDYRKIGPDRYRADYLFKVNQPFRTDLRIALNGAVAPEHLDRLSKKRRAADKKSEVWTLHPAPPTTAWQPGEYLLLSQTFISPAIPYNMSMNFYAPTRKPGQYGDTVQLGWRRGITESVLLDSIRRTNSLIDLYRLKGDCENLPAAQEAFKRKASELLEKTAPLGIICEEADLVAFDYRQIGENQYRVDYLFHVNRPLEHDCLIALYGVVDENHRDLLSEERKKLGKRSEEWTFRPYPPTRAWPEGECVLVSDEIEAQPIPYNMHTILYDRENQRQHGDQVALGWRADPGRPAPEEN
ncbi:MAG: hypothetical protein V1789_04210 [PVC group bacterium]